MATRHKKSAEGEVAGGFTLDLDVERVRIGVSELFTALVCEGTGDCGSLAAVVLLMEEQEGEEDDPLSCLVLLQGRGGRRAEWWHGCSEG